MSCGIGFVEPTSPAAAGFQKKRPGGGLRAAHNILEVPSNTSPFVDGVQKLAPPSHGREWHMGLTQKNVCETIL